MLLNFYSSLQISGCGDNVALVQNGFCNDETNIAACNYDGGDCCGSCVLTEYCSNCDCLGGLTSVEITNPLIGNGLCNEETNNIQCDYDGGDCCLYPDMVDNGICNDETNNLECNYDGGDCCGPAVFCKYSLFYLSIFKINLMAPFCTIVTVKHIYQLHLVY